MIEWITNNKEWVFSGLGISIVGAMFYIFNVTTSRMQKKLRVLVHKAYFQGNATPFYFVKVINLTKEDLEITHVWLQASPEIHITRSERPLPYRLKPNETWETWMEETRIPKALRVNPYKLVHVMLSTGRAYSSKENKGVPREGFVAGPKRNS